MASVSETDKVIKGYKVMYEVEIYNLIISEDDSIENYTWSHTKIKLSSVHRENDCLCVNFNPWAIIDSPSKGSLKFTKNLMVTYH